MKIVTDIEDKIEPVYLKLETQEDIDKIYAIFNSNCVVHNLFGEILSNRIRDELRSKASDKRTWYTDKINTAIREH